MIKYEDIQKENMLLPEDEKEPYIGFQLGYFHSKNMGIKRVNTNNRYQQSLVPNFELKTNQDTKIGTRLYKQEVKDKQIKIDFAFDNLTQNEFDQIKNWLGNSELQPLILDEEENYSYVKIYGQPNINYICFDEEKNGIVQRIYKGEGGVNFIQYKMDKNKTVKPVIDYVTKYVDLSNSYVQFLPADYSAPTGGMGWNSSFKPYSDDFQLTPFSANGQLFLQYKSQPPNEEVKDYIKKHINMLYGIPIKTVKLVYRPGSRPGDVKPDHYEDIFYTVNDLKTLDVDTAFLNIPVFASNIIQAVARLLQLNGNGATIFSSLEPLPKSISLQDQFYTIKKQGWLDVLDTENKNESDNTYEIDITIAYKTAPDSYSSSSKNYTIHFDRSEGEYINVIELSSFGILTIKTNLNQQKTIDLSDINWLQHLRTTWNKLNPKADLINTICLYLYGTIRYQFKYTCNSVSKFQTISLPITFLKEYET